MTGVFGIGASIAVSAARAAREKIEQVTESNQTSARQTSVQGNIGQASGAEATGSISSTSAVDEKAVFDNLEPHQYNVTTRSFAPPESFGGGFQGDNRGYSLEPDVTSRIRSQVLVDTTEQGVIDSRKNSDPSVIHFLPNYRPEEDPDLEIQKNQFTQTDDTTTTRFRSKHSGEDAVPRIHLPDEIPFVHDEFNISPALDVNTELSIVNDSDANTLRVTGEITGDNFPATEVFITDSSGQSLFLATGKPPAIASPIFNLPNEFGIPVKIPGLPIPLLPGLPGAPTVTVNRHIADVDVTVNTDDDGNFVSVEQNGETISIDQWNQQFENRDPSFIDPLEPINAAALEVREGYVEIGREIDEARREIGEADGVFETANEIREAVAEIRREGVELVDESVRAGATAAKDTARDIAGVVGDKISFWN